MSEMPDYHISENAAAGIGICVLIVLIAIAVTIFILCGMKTKKYEFLEKEDIETAYGVSGMYAFNACCNRNLFYCEKCSQNECNEPASRGGRLHQAEKT